MGTVKNREGSEALPYLLANRLACHHFLGCRHKTGDPWVRDKGLYHPRHSKWPELQVPARSPCQPQVPQDNPGQRRWVLCGWEICPAGVDPELREPGSLKMDSEYSYLLLSRGDTIFIFRDGSLDKKVVCNKGHRCLCS